MILWPSLYPGENLGAGPAAWVARSFVSLGNATGYGLFGFPVLMCLSRPFVLALLLLAVSPTSSQQMLIPKTGAL